MDDMNISDVRRRNLRALVDKAGGAAALVRQSPGLDASYISQLLNGHRQFGEKAARKFEQTCGLAMGTLDRPIGSEANDSARIAVAMPGVLGYPTKAKNVNYDAVLRSLSKFCESLGVSFGEIVAHYRDPADGVRLTKEEWLDHMQLAAASGGRAREMPFVIALMKQAELLYLAARHEDERLSSTAAQSHEQESNTRERS